MKNIKEVLSEPLSNYSGSEKTYALVAEQIEKKWGKKEVENYDPYRNTLTFARWLSLGYRVKPGEKALVSNTVVEEKDEDGQPKKRIPRKVFLFYYKQVEKITA